MKTSYKISGMTCSGCVQVVHNSLLKADGVTRVDIDLAEARARVESEHEVPLKTLKAALAGTLYKITDGEETTPDKEQARPTDEISEKNKELVTGYVKAAGRLDHEALSKYLHPEFKFSGAVTYRSAAEYIEMIKEHIHSPVAGILVEYDIKAVFADEKDCCVIYDSVSRFPGKKVSFAERIQVENGKIISTEVKFNRHQMKQLMQEVNR